ncbi:ATP-binding cassette domain-containing protein [Siccirubricoccus deserti]
MALLGPAGSGKTAALRILAGQDTADAGSATLHGEPLFRIPPDRRGFGLLVPPAALFRNRTVQENVAHPLIARGAGGGTAGAHRPGADPARAGWVRGAQAAAAAAAAAAPPLPGPGGGGGAGGAAAGRPAGRPRSRHAPTSRPRDAGPVPPARADGAAGNAGGAGGDGAGRSHHRAGGRRGGAGGDAAGSVRGARHRLRRQPGRREQPAARHGAGAGG